MAIIRWSPLEEMSLLRNQIDRIFDPANGTYSSNKNTFKHFLPIEVTETPEAYRVQVLAPSIEPEQIKIESSAKELTITATNQPRELNQDETVHVNELHYGEFSRHLAFPQAINTDSIEAEYGLGILHIHLPKMESAKSKSVEIKIRS